MTGTPKTYWCHLAAALSLTAGVMLLSACGDAEQHKPQLASKQSAIRFGFAVYYLPEPTADVSRVINRALTTISGAPARNESLSEAPASNFVQMKMLEPFEDGYEPPKVESLHYFGRGLDAEQARQLQLSKRACVLTFTHPRQEAWANLCSACELVEKVARETGGLIWDDQTRLLYTPDAWHETLLTSRDNVIPNAAEHITIHAYNDGDFVRGITLGMSKFGLPDVVVEEFSWQTNRAVGNLINAFCQALVEGADFECPGEFDLDLYSLKNEEARDVQLTGLKKNADGVARLTLRVGEPDEGDPSNDLIEIRCDRYEGPDDHARQEKLLTQLFGSEDHAVSIRHDEAILAASERAKARLEELRASFEAGFAPGEHLLVKAPFDGPGGGREWMWVEVTRWSGDQMEGLLSNEPVEIPDLHAGQIVQVQQDDVFDFMRQFADGRQEGNETGELIEQLQR